MCETIEALIGPDCKEIVALRESLAAGSAIGKHVIREGRCRLHAVSLVLRRASFADALQRGVIMVPSSESEPPLQPCFFRLVFVASFVILSRRRPRPQDRRQFDAPSVTRVAGLSL